MSVAQFTAPHESVHSRTLTVSEETREVHLGGELIELTRTEFNLLSILYRNPRRVLTPEVLLAPFRSLGRTDSAANEVRPR